ncbi:hypothetical protein BDW59DRAFT_163823 [Aspergillus cavernicola]|uniref:Uncharacterized protein n=1 Tax=Aspergillus cavernicola TaxID=176166 RepID=A0ABR4I3C3_9EURO
MLPPQGEEPASYPMVFLVTSPRVWNHKFCPASFWFLYSDDSHLRAMIVEVNNTFDERRLYFLATKDNSRGPGVDTLRRFQHTWPKDFHVSPFNSRKRKYSVSARDPSQPSTSPNAVVQITATLLASSSRPKMVTRLWTDERPINPFTISAMQAVRLLLPWCLVGLLTYPRIVFQATMLAHRRKLPIWYRPEPRMGTIPRRPTSSERYLCPVLCAYIKQILLFAPDAFHLHLHLYLQPPTDPPNSHNHIRFSTPTAASTPSSPTIVLTVLTPRFYAILLGHRTLTSFLRCACLDPAVENHTAQIQAHPLHPVPIKSGEWGVNEELMRLISHAEVSYERSYPRNQNRPSPLLGTPLQYLLDVILAAVRPLRGGIGGVYPYPGLPWLRLGGIYSATLSVDSGGRNEDVGGKREFEGVFLDDFARSHYGAFQRVLYVAQVVRALVWEGVVRFIGGA